MSTHDMPIGAELAIVLASSGAVCGTSNCRPCAMVRTVDIAVAISGFMVQSDALAGSDDS